MQRSPLLDRFNQILDSPWAGLILLALALAVGVLILLVALRAYRVLFLALLFGQTFSMVGGSVQGLLTLTRYGALLGLLVIGIAGLPRCGIKQWTLLLFGVYTALLSPIALLPSFSAQLAGAFLLAVGAVAGATASYVTDYGRAKKLLAVVLLASWVYVITNAVAGGTLGAERGAGEGRFAGVMGSVQSLAVIGGVLAPFLLWGFLQPGRLVSRLISLGCLMVLLPMLVFAGQRIGVFAALAGMMPLLTLRLSTKRLLGGAALATIAVIASLLILSTASRHTKAYIFDKLIYRVADTHGRAERWAMLLKTCMENPFLGHGYGTGDTQIMIYHGTGAHNAFLTLWYDGGLIAVLAWVAVIVASLVTGLRLLRTRAPPDVKDTVRLLVGCLGALTLQALFEQVLASNPTGFGMGMLVLLIGLIDRLALFVRESEQGFGDADATAGFAPHAAPWVGTRG